ncbi:MAG: ribonuclease P component 1 family protein [Thermoplasmatota archaeon]
MLLTPAESAKGEFIGSRVRISASGDPTLRELSGRVTDETRNTFTIERDDGREAIVAKHGQTFVFDSGHESTFVLVGSDLTFSPHDRTKKARLTILR